MMERREQRVEFPRRVKRDAFFRAEGRCEASGAVYGLPDDVRCDARLAHGGVEYDHEWPAAEGGEPTLENCRVVCPACHRWKTSRRDQPTLAKIQRVRDGAMGIKGKRQPMPGGRRSAFKRKMNGEVIKR